MDVIRMSRRARIQVELESRATGEQRHKSRQRAPIDARAMAKGKGTDDVEYRHGGRADVGARYRVVVRCVVTARVANRNGRAVGRGRRGRYRIGSFRVMRYRREQAARRHCANDGAGITPDAKLDRVRAAYGALQDVDVCKRS